MFFVSIVVMKFKQGTNRHQTCFITLNQQVSTGNPVRLIDAFVDKLKFPPEPHPHSKATVKTP